MWGAGPPAKFRFPEPRPPRRGGGRGTLRARPQPRQGEGPAQRPVPRPPARPAPAPRPACATRGPRARPRTPASPAAEAAARSPASRLPESPAAAAVPSRPADSSSYLVQELSQDTHGPRARPPEPLPPLIGWTAGGGRGSRGSGLSPLAGAAEAGQRKTTIPRRLLPVPSPSRSPGDPHSGRTRASEIPPPRPILSVCYLTLRKRVPRDPLSTSGAPEETALAHR